MSTTSANLSSETLAAIEKLARQEVERRNRDAVVMPDMVDRLVRDLLAAVESRQAQPSRFDWTRAINGGLKLRGAAPIYPATAAEDAKFVEGLRSLSPTSSPGTFLCPTMESDQFISQLSLGSTMRKAGATQWPMSGIENLTIPTGLTNPAFLFMAQNSKQTPDVAANLSQVSFTLKEHRALIQLPLQLFRVARPSLQSLMPTFFAWAAGESEDVALHASVTQSDAPTALMSASGITFQNVGGSANGGSIALSDILGMVQKAAELKLRFPWCFFASPRTWTRLYSLQATTSQLLLGPPTTQGGEWSLVGHPLYLTNSISNAEALGSGSALSHLVLCHPQNIHIGEDHALAFEVSNEFAFDAAQTTLRIIHHVDAAYAPGPGFVVLRGIA